MTIISRAEAKEKGLKRYFTGKLCRNRHVSERSTNDGKCCCCVKSRRDKYYKDNYDLIIERNRRYIAENATAVDASRKAYVDKNKRLIASKKKAYTENNKTHIKKKGKERYEKDHEVMKKKASDNYHKNKGRISVQRKKYRELNYLYVIERDRINRVKHKTKNSIAYFVRHSLARILVNWKGGRAKQEAVHGYSYEALTERITSQFVDGMSWENRSEWHIDHIKPIKAFLDDGTTDPSIINALSNLQPLWAKDNLSKGAKYNETN